MLVVIETFLVVAAQLGVQPSLVSDYIISEPMSMRLARDNA